jgi:hypothetical protein
MVRCQPSTQLGMIFASEWAPTRSVKDHLTFGVCQGNLDMEKLTFYGIRESAPGPRWRQLFDATWDGYRNWYFSEGESARPSLKLGHRMLQRHMPELIDTWERLVDLAAGDEAAARMLTLYDPPRFLPACSQLALTGDTSMLSATTITTRTSASEWCFLAHSPDAA